MEMKYNSLIIISAFILALIACKKKEIGPQCPSCTSDEIESNYNDILIGCEGNFGWGNASLSVLNTKDTIISNQVFNSINGFSVGDVLQDISYNEFDYNYYLVVNNSGKIIVIDTNYIYQNTISGFTSPRYISFINASKAYVTDLYSNEISIVDLTNQNIQSTIPINGWSEKILTLGSTTWVAIQDTNQIIRIDNQTDNVLDTFVVSKGPNSIISGNQNVWVLCDGGINEDTAAVYQFNLQGQLLKQINFPSTIDNPTCLQINSSNQLFYLNQGVYRMNYSDNSLPLVPIISETGIFYNLAIGPEDGIYITDAIDYVQPGKLFTYDSIGNLINEFITGVIPQDICFRP